MSMSAADFDKLIEMQTLCSLLEQDVEKLSAFGHALDAIHERYRILNESYQADWLRLVESEDLDEEQIAQLEGMLKDGAFSILGQDTIWNALSDTHELYTALLKSLAQKL